MANSLFSPDTKFARFMNTLWGVLLVGLLWVICSLPVFTMGTASCAAHDTMRRAVRKPGGTVTGTFFTSFRSNFKITLPFDMIFTVIFGLLIFDCIYLFGYGTEFSNMLSIVLYVFLAFFGVLGIYIFSLCAYYDDTRLAITKLGFYITFRHFGISVILAVLIPVTLYAVWLMPWSAILLPGGFWFIQSVLLELVMRHYIEDEEEAEEPWVVEDEEPSAPEEKPSRRKAQTVTQQTADMNEIAERLLLDSDPDRIVEK